MKKISKNKLQQFSRRALIVALFVILIEVLFENFIVEVFKTQVRALELGFLFVYMFLQIVFAPLQSGVSDFIGRKKSIQISLAVTFISLILVLIFFKLVAISIVILIVAVFIKGIAGNNLPLSLSIIADTQQGRDYRFSFALSSGTYAIAFIAAIYTSQNLLNYSLIALIFFLFLVCLTSYFKDVQDTDIANVNENNTSIKHSNLLKNILHEPQVIKNDLKQRSTRQALMAFLLWEISMYTVLNSQLDTKIYLIPNLAVFMMIGYLIGVFLLRFSYRISNPVMIKYGYCLSTISFIPYYFCWLFSLDMLWVTCVSFFLHALGNALLSPTFMAILAEEKPPHEQGKRYGLVESVDTIAFLVSALVIIFFKSHNITLFSIVNFTFVAFIVSWKYYGRFQKI